MGLVLDAKPEYMTKKGINEGVPPPPVGNPAVYPTGRGTVIYNNPGGTKTKAKYNE